VGVDEIRNPILGGAVHQGGSAEEGEAERVVGMVPSTGIQIGMVPDQDGVGHQADLAPTRMTTENRSLLKAQEGYPHIRDGVPIWILARSVERGRDADIVAHLPVGLGESLDISTHRRTGPFGILGRMFRRE
jgi:hypothetical protein